MSHKFDDCRTCRFRERQIVCRYCDVGEFFEEEAERPLRFGDADICAPDKYLVSDDDERRELSAEDLLGRLDDGDDGDAHEED